MLYVPPMSFWITWLLLALSLAPLAWTFSYGAVLPSPWASALAAPALVGLVVTAAARLVWGRPSRDPRAFTVWSLCLGWTWWSFWLEDLRFARFQAVLLLVPAAAAAVCLGRYLLGAGGPWREALTGGICLGLGLAWSFAMLRSDASGCGGVSSIYSGTMGVTWLALFLMGPWVAELCRAPGSASLWPPAPLESPGTARRSDRTAPGARGDGSGGSSARPSGG